MTASDIVRVVMTIGFVQLVCDLLSTWRVFQNEKYQRSVSSLQRAKARLDKEKQQQTATAATATTGTAAAAVSHRKSKELDKTSKRLKRLEEEYAEAQSIVARFHFVPNIVCSIIFLILLRVLGLEFQGKIVAFLPFEPFVYLQKITARGLEWDPSLAARYLMEQKEAAAADSSSSSIGVNTLSQACSFMTIYTLTSLSVKFYINKLVGVGSPPEAGNKGIFGYVDSPAGQKMLKAWGMDDETYNNQMNSSNNNKRD